MRCLLPERPSSCLPANETNSRSRSTRRNRRRSIGRLWVLVARKRSIGGLQRTPTARNFQVQVKGYYLDGHCPCRVWWENRSPQTQGREEGQGSRRSDDHVHRPHARLSSLPAEGKVHTEHAVPKVAPGHQRGCP